MKTNNEIPTQYEWGPFPFKDGTRVLDIRYDPVFKAVFTKDTSKSRGALSDLISTFIGRNVSVETVIANEPPIDDTRQRYLRFDVACKTKNGELVNVEMSFNPKEDELVSFEYYIARLFVSQDIHGKEKDYNELKETYHIVILAKERFFPDDSLTHNFMYYDPDNHVSLGGKTKIITVELVKTEPAADKQVSEMTGSELWAVFFQYLTDEKRRDKIIEIINTEDGIAMATETLVNVTQDEIEYMRMTALITGKLDYQSRMNTARRKGLKEGREEGLKEGREEERIEITKNLLSKGSTFEFISDVTGLSLDEVKSIAGNK